MSCKAQSYNKLLNIVCKEVGQYYIIIVQFKRSGSRHIHKEIKIQKAMKGMGRILCKTDLILIQRHIYKCNTFSDVDFEAFSKTVYVPLWYSQFQ